MCSSDVGKYVTMAASVVCGFGTLWICCAPHTARRPPASSTRSCGFMFVVYQYRHIPVPMWLFPLIVCVSRLNGKLLAGFAGWVGTQKKWTVWPNAQSSIYEGVDIVIQISCWKSHSLMHRGKVNPADWTTELSGWLYTQCLLTHKCRWFNRINKREEIQRTHRRWVIITQNPHAASDRLGNIRVTRMDMRIE